MYSFMTSNILCCVCVIGPWTSCVLLRMFCKNFIVLLQNLYCQQTFQRWFNVVVVRLRRRDGGHCQINIETTLCMPTWKFTTLNNVETTLRNVKTTLSISLLILTTLDNVETMLLLSTLSFTTLINVKTTL